MSDSSSANEDLKLCASCGKRNDEARRCSRCLAVHYCDAKCQKSHWSTHKKHCIAPNSTCTRCLETIVAGGTCKVEHPEHLLQECGSMFGPEGATHSYFCEACNTGFSKRAPMSFMENSGNELPWTYDPPGSQWCFQGSHTVKRLPSSDQRRIATDIVAISATSDVQEKIDALANTEVRVLTIKSTGGCYDDTIKPTLNVCLPKLEQLILSDVCFQKVALTPELTPNLQDLEMQNIPDECDMQVTCPSLLNFDMRYYHGDCFWVDEMLVKTKKLQTFRSYKLGVDAIYFASNDLTEIHLHRSDCLQQVFLWAPRLEYLRLQGCYSLDSIQILDDHPVLAKDLANGFVKSTFVVETTNSCLSPRFVSVLSSHDRIEWQGEEEDEYAGVGGTGMESLFANLHRGMGM